MLNIEKKQEGNTLTVKLDGRLDTNTAPVFQGEVEKIWTIMIMKKYIMHI